MAKVVLDEVAKVYPDGTEAITDLDLEIDDGEFMVFVGPSGCGKTTALRMVAGLEDISRGTIAIGDRVVNDVPSKDRDLAMVFQNYALYPHLKVYDNMAFGLRLRKEDKAEIDRRVRQAAEVLGLEELPGSQAQEPVRRPAPACRHGAGDRAGAARVPHGRAALQPRREAPRADASRDRPAAGRPRRHDDLRHPRPDRGHDDGRSGRGDQEGPPAAGRRAPGALRPPRQPLRRRLHRLAGDEHGAGGAAPRG